MTEPFPDAQRIEIPAELLLRLYGQMVMIRRFEEQAAKAYTLQKIKGFCHLYIGQEAVAVGACAAVRPDDDVVAAYRDHGHVLARGASPDAVMAELFGKSTGVTQGIGGSMHLACREANFWGGYGIVGAHVPLGAGAAFAARYTGSDRVSLTFFGEGAAQQGAFYEALELAQLWQLPAVFICENNFYAMGTSLDRASYERDMSRRGAGLGMRHESFEADDVTVVYRKVAHAVALARAGHGPTLLEARTYRWQGHSMSDPAKYRTREELEAARETRDALRIAERLLREEHGVDEATLERLRDEAKAVAKRSYEAAEAAPEPPLDGLYGFTWAEVTGG
jgi:pyruvate dehydrogenase E1 component alpha subunit